MNVTYTIQFKGFHEKAAAALEKMLRDDIAAYPKRLRMESASVKKHSDVKVWTGDDGVTHYEPAVPTKPKPKPKAKVKPALHTTDIVTVTEVEMEEAVERGDVTPTVEAPLGKPIVGDTKPDVFTPPQGQIKTAAPLPIKKPAKPKSKVKRNAKPR